MTIVADVTAPNDVLELATIKEHLRIDGSQDDTILGMYLAAATANVELFTGQMLGTRTIDITMDSWPSGDTLVLPAWPITALATVSYTDVDGATSVFSSDSYTESLAGIPARLVLNDGDSWPDDQLQIVDAIVIRATAGYSGDNIPVLAEQLLLLTIGLWYENREGLQPVYLKEIPTGLQGLGWGLRVTL